MDEQASFKNQPAVREVIITSQLDILRFVCVNRLCLSPVQLLPPHVLFRAALSTRYHFGCRHHQRDAGKWLRLHAVQHWQVSEDGKRADISR